MLPPRRPIASQRMMQMQLRKVATIPPGNHMPKPPVEVYPLFAIVAVPLAFATYIMYEKLVNDTGVIVTKPRWESGFRDDLVNQPSHTK